MDPSSERKQDQPAGRLASAPQAGHRSAQLGRVARLIDEFGRAGSLLDIGTGSGWLVQSWPDQGIGMDLVPSLSWEKGSKHWVLASVESIPFRDESFKTIAAVGVLGGLQHSTLGQSLQEIARVLDLGGRLIVLVSLKHFVYDVIAPHRVLSRWTWRGFDRFELIAELRQAGLTLIHEESRGKVRSLLAEWGSYLFMPFVRVRRLKKVWERIGSMDSKDFGDSRRGGSRYLYLVLQKDE